MWDGVEISRNLGWDGGGPHKKFDQNLGPTYHMQMRVLLMTLLASCGTRNYCAVSEDYRDGGYVLRTMTCRVYTVEVSSVMASMQVNRASLDAVIAGLESDGVRIVNSYRDHNRIAFAARLAESYGGTQEQWLAMPQMVGGVIYVPWDPGDETNYLHAMLTYAHEYQHVLQERAEGSTFGTIYGLDLMARAYYEADAVNAERDLISATGPEAEPVLQSWGEHMAAGYGTGADSVSTYLGIVRAGDLARRSGWFSTRAAAMFVQWANGAA